MQLIDSLFRCVCEHGKISADGKTCDYTGYGIYASENYILLKNLEGDDQYVHLLNGIALGIDFDYEKNFIFYSIRQEYQWNGTEWNGMEWNGTERNGNRLN